mmetsp:Transcript_26475/g.39332  ORF Transcript_26475/g.39332 Transcript_26475/m.39332 type:complete len:99 (+) Transcript_26475:2985-3281(+)
MYLSSVFSRIQAQEYVWKQFGAPVGVKGRSHFSRALIIDSQAPSWCAFTMGSMWFNFFWAPGYDNDENYMIKDISQVRHSHDTHFRKAYHEDVDVEVY